MAPDGFRQRLSALLSERGLSLRGLAEASGVSKTTVADLAAGRRGARMSVDTVAKLATAFNVRAEWLATGQGPMAHAEGGAGVDDYPSRRRAAEFAREAGIMPQAIADVLAIAPASSRDPGARYWYERMVRREAELSDEFAQSGPAKKTLPPGPTLTAKKRR